MALSITVNKKAPYYDGMRDRDLGFKCCYNVNSVYTPEINDEGEVLGDIYDMVNMFVEAAKSEGYGEVSIAQALYDISILMASECIFKLKSEDGDSDYFMK